MFKVGSVYTFHLIEGGDESTSVWQVVEFEPPLIKIHNPHFQDSPRILNVGSLNFIGATLFEESVGEDYWTRDAEFEARFGTSDPPGRRG